MLTTAAALIAVTLAAPLAEDRRAVGLSYGEALGRAEKYEAERASEDYRLKTLYPALTPRMPALFSTCYPESVRRPVEFTMILSFKGGRFDRIEVNSDDPVARCVVRVFEGYSYPRPPHDDFAEEIHFDLKPRSN